MNFKMRKLACHFIKHSFGKFYLYIYIYIKRARRGDVAIGCGISAPLSLFRPSNSCCEERCAWRLARSRSACAVENQPALAPAAPANPFNLAGMRREALEQRRRVNPRLPHPSNAAAAKNVESSAALPLNQTRRLIERGRWELLSLNAARMNSI